MPNDNPSWSQPDKPSIKFSRPTDPGGLGQGLLAEFCPKGPAIYLNDKGVSKVKVALAEGKATGDKREALKQCEQKREMEHMHKGARE